MSGGRLGGRRRQLDIGGGRDSRRGSLGWNWCGLWRRCVQDNDGGFCVWRLHRDRKLLRPRRRKLHRRLSKKDEHEGDHQGRRKANDNEEYPFHSLTLVNNFPSVERAGPTDRTLSFQENPVCRTAKVTRSRVVFISFSLLVSRF